MPLLNPDKIAELEKKLEETLPDVDESQLHYSLADAIREGSTITTQEVGTWTDGEGTACALMAAFYAVKARHLA